MAGEHPLSQEEFDDIYSRVPRLTVELIIRNEERQIYLAKRAIEPCIGQWHLPGGTVRFGEKLEEAAERVAGRELSIQIERAANVGYIEYPSHFRNGLDSPVGIVFEIHEYTGKIATNAEAQDGDWFRVMPEPMHADQDVFLAKNGYLLLQGITPRTQ